MFTDIAANAYFECVTEPSESKTCWYVEEFHVCILLLQAAPIMPKLTLHVCSEGFLVEVRSELGDSGGHKTSFVHHLCSLQVT
jgi:hypothetical protein